MDILQKFERRKKRFVFKQLDANIIGDDILFENSLLDCLNLTTNGLENVFVRLVSGNDFLAIRYL